MLSMGSLYNSNPYSAMPAAYSGVGYTGMGSMMPPAGNPYGSMMGGSAGYSAITQTTTTTYQVPTYTPPVVCMMPVICQMPMMMAVPVSSALQEIPPVPTSIAPIQPQAQPPMAWGGNSSAYLPYNNYQNYQLPASPAPTATQEPVDTQSLYSMLPLLLQVVQALLQTSQATPADPTQNTTDTPVPDPVPPTPTYIPPNYNGGGQGSYWGDPHLIGFDGEKYDVMGESGKTYNMLSDQGVQYNTTFESWGNKGATVISKAGIQVGDQKIYFDRSGDAPTINGQAMIVGNDAPLPDGGSASWDGTKLTVKTKEYTIDLQVKDQNNPMGSYLDSHVSVNDGGPFSDMVAPHGLLGQTADGVDGQKNTGTDQGKQGGTVIDGTVQDYEEADLWSHSSQFSRFDATIGQVIADPDSGAVQKVLDTNGRVLFQLPDPQPTVAA